MMAEFIPSHLPLHLIVRQRFGPRTPLANQSLDFMCVHNLLAAFLLRRRRNPTGHRDGLGARATMCLFMGPSFRNGNCK